MKEAGQVACFLIVTTPPKLCAISEINTKNVIAFIKK